MVRGKIQMRRIENATNRQVTLSKRRNGLLKKAHALSVLCDVEVAVIIFSQKGRFYEFSSTEGKILIVYQPYRMRKIIERYRKQPKDHEQTNMTEADQQYMQANLMSFWGKQLLLLSCPFASSSLQSLPLPTCYFLRLLFQFN